MRKLLLRIIAFAAGVGLRWLAETAALVHDLSEGDSPPNGYALAASRALRKAKE